MRLKATSSTKQACPGSLLPLRPMDPASSYHSDSSNNSFVSYHYLSDLRGFVWWASLCVVRLCVVRLCVVEPALNCINPLVLLRNQADRGWSLWLWSFHYSARILSWHTPIWCLESLIPEYKIKRNNALGGSWENAPKWFSNIKVFSPYQIVNMALIVRPLYISRPQLAGIQGIKKPWVQKLGVLWGTGLPSGKTDALITPERKFFQTLHPPSDM